MRSLSGYHKFSGLPVLRNFVRHWQKSLLSGLVGLLTVFLLAAYMGNMESARAQLAALPAALPVTGKISNLNGSLDAGLKIPEKTVQGIAEAKELKGQVFTVLLRAGLGVFTLEEWEGNLNFFVVGANDLAGVPGLKKEEICFWGDADEGILRTAEDVCIVDAWTMEQNGLSPGDEILLTFFYYRFGNDTGSGNTVFIEPLCSTYSRIVGVMDIEEYTGTVGCPNLIVPFDSARRMFHGQDIPFTADSVSFTVADPFRLNACKEELHTLGLLPVMKNAEYRFDGNAVTLRDDTFIRAAENLRESLAILQGILPFVLCMIVCAGYLCSYLLMQSRRPEYATMRSLGMSWRHCFLLLLAESAVTETAACATGSLLALAILKTQPAVLLLAGGLFLGAFLAGTAGALWSFRRLSVMAVLGRGD